MLSKEGFGSQQELSSSGSLKRIEAFCRRIIFSKLNHIHRGYLEIIDDEGEHQFGSVESDGPHVRMHIQQASAYRDVLLSTDIGLGKAYMEGKWVVSDLTLLFQLFLQNEAALRGLESGLARLGQMVNQQWHALRANTIKGSKKNISAHYDLGNDFYQLFLDETMMYSSAVFESPQSSLFDASTHKLDLICQKLNLSSHDTVLEIGTGWGGFAIHAAKNYGCQVVTTTISEAQYAWAIERVAEAQLEDRITVLQQDYRTLEGQYDKIVSIEMIEAVGHQYLGLFFQTCQHLLKENGAFLLQSITINEQRYEQAKNHTDFIQRYIFPGGDLPSVTAIMHATTEHTDLRVQHIEDFGRHYALTLNHWRHRFLQALNDVRQQGYPESFIRMWQFYLCYCEAGFLERATGCFQFVFHKPMTREEVPLR
ncbi:MAG TPA: SAM-dependent methyltransferase [Gammaproteobacteria bacterium]|nr:SAM-dependent methyltransferase [Gammaproteobacteria bacterium]